MRLFLAALPPAAALAELGATAAGLRALPGAEGLRWTAEDGWHITLAFLGRVDEQRLPELREVLARAGAEGPAHRLRLAGGGRFGERVLWVGLAGQTRALRSLAQRAGRAVDEVHPLEQEHDYHPHLTLARTPRGGPPDGERRRALRRAAELLEAFQGVEWPVTEFHLMCSEFADGRPHYTSVTSWPLAG
ncbi:RNA 2',3'-cyclic phosphodiesterase [Kitasatospora nipponensis]|uniref:RNA 2',3'-cyclic phosphodiesterase n=1 Tax=Kitasatospora nipponensis TaxID=258049 RepID=A0ABN1VRP1_9ACTN